MGSMACRVLAVSAALIPAQLVYHREKAMIAASDNGITD